MFAHAPTRRSSTLPPLPLLPLLRAHTPATPYSRCPTIPLPRCPILHRPTVPRTHCPAAPLRHFSHSPSTTPRTPSLPAHIIPYQTTRHSVYIHIGQCAFTRMPTSDFNNDHHQTSMNSGISQRVARTSINTSDITTSGMCFTRTNTDQNVMCVWTANS